MLGMIYKTHTVAGYVRVNGRKLNIVEYPDFEFFSYRTGRGYFVCEKQTGLALAWGKRLKFAKKEGLRRMGSMPLEAFKALIKTRLERYGYANKKGG
jgi:hypothetical protein